MSNGATHLVETGSVQSGLDRLAAGEGPDLSRCHVALLCHPASVDKRIRHVTDIFHDLGVTVVSLLGPEHGIEAAAQDMAEVPGDPLLSPSQDAAYGPRTPQYSLYGKNAASLRPTVDMFGDANWLVCDLQDVGSRYYTYVWTAVMAAEVALADGRNVLILDRPNPIGGGDHSIEGATIETGFESFVGFHPVAVRHGMTLGELTCMALAERGTSTRDRLKVLTCSGWRRDMLFPATGLRWVMPSPNMPTFDTAMVYPGQCLFEGTQLSEGRGTTRPFEIVGAPWVDGRALADAVTREERPGIVLRPLRFTPTFHKHVGITCGGVQLHVVDANATRSLGTAVALLRELWRQGAARRGANAFRWRTEPYEFVSDIPAVDLLAGGSWLREGIESGVPAPDLLASQADARDAFIARRRPFLVYD
ncbi:MAG: DUF1343 domain-containing protein [Nannocystaceae bacterium]